MILITGSTGFIGKHLLRALLEKYGMENVVSLTSNPTKDSRFLLHQNYTFNKSYFIQSGYDSIETIIHAGAYTPKSSSQANDIDKCNSNIINTTALLNSDFPKLKKVIFLSTLDVYGLDEVITENSPLQPLSLYGYSKLYCEKLIPIIANNRSIVHQILRIGHVYGPGEEAYEKIIPVIFRKIVNRQSIQLVGSGNEIRSFIYIDDVVSAILNSIELDRYMGPVNIVSENKITINELLSVIKLISGVNVSIERKESNYIGKDLIFDNTKMKTELNIIEKSLYEGLIEEWNYMKGNL
jgi:UDP-glucose 4-epimerase